MATNYKQVYAIKENNKQKILQCNPFVPEKSGIYILTRYEDDFKYFYVGQAKNILSRLVDHLSGYQKIDNSIRKRGLHSIENITGWYIEFVLCDDLETKEKELIKEYVNSGYIPYNLTTGGQGQGKKNLGDKVVKGYQNGLHNGYNKARKDIAKLFDKNLVAVINGSSNKNKEKALEKFKEFIKVE